MSKGKVIKKEKKKEWLFSLTVEISKEEFDKKVNELSKKYAKSLELPGFRKGKVPPAILMKKYGDSIKDEAFYELVDKTYKDTLSEEKINPIAVGNITNVDMESLKYTAEIEVMPEINIEKYKGLEVEYKPFKYSDEYLDSEIEYLRRSNGEYVPVDRTANSGDLVVIDMKAIDKNGKEVREFTMENFAIALGGGYIFKELEDLLIGRKSGSTLNSDITIPGDYKNSQLASKSLKFRIIIKEIKTLLLPNLDDDFAKDMGYKDLDDLKKNIKENLENEAKKEELSEKESKLLQKIEEENPFELPISLIKEKARYLTKYFHKKEKDKAKIEELEKQYIPIAETYFKKNLVIDKIAEKEKIEPSEVKINEEIKNYAEKMKMGLEKAKEVLEKDGSLEHIKSKIVSKEVMDFLFENNKFIPVKEEGGKPTEKPIEEISEQPEDKNEERKEEEN